MCPLGIVISIVQGWTNRKERLLRRQFCHREERGDLACRFRPCHREERGDLGCPGLADSEKRDCFASNSVIARNVAISPFIVGKQKREIASQVILSSRGTKRSRLSIPPLSSRGTWRSRSSGAGGQRKERLLRKLAMTKRLRRLAMTNKSSQLQTAALQ